MTETIYDFTPVEGFDATELPPEAPPGFYEEALCTNVKVAATTNEKLPMLILEYRLPTEPPSEVADFVWFAPAGHKNYRMTVEHFRSLCDAAQVDPAVVPKTIQSKADLADAIAAFQGRTWPLYLTLQKNGRTRISYTAPRGMMGLGPSSSIDEPEETVTPLRNGGTSRNGATTNGHKGTPPTKGRSIGKTPPRRA